MASTTQWPEVAKLPIGKPPPLNSPRFRDDIPSDDDMGFNDPDNVLYVNMEGPDLGERFKARIEELEQMLKLTHQLATIHAGIQVRDRKREGSLPTDDSKDSSWRRSQYRARVFDSYFKDGVYTWMYSPHRNTVTKRIDIARSQFHWQILSNILEGIVLPRPLVATLEAIFKGIADTINESNFTGDGRTFWSMLQVYTYDGLRDDLRASLRNISYSLDQQMYTVSKGKSSMTTIGINWDFDQTDFAFNESTWRSLKHEVENYINNTGIDGIINPPTVPV